MIKRLRIILDPSLGTGLGTQIPGLDTPGCGYPWSRCPHLGTLGQAPSLRTPNLGTDPCLGTLSLVIPTNLS